jgi:hypothetical protein
VWQGGERSGGVPRSPGSAAVLVTGSAILIATAVCVATSLAADSPLPSVHAGQGVGDPFLAKVFALAQIGAFAAYVLGLGLLRVRAASPRLVVAIAVVIQLLPLLAPVIMSTDAWQYWNTGRLGGIHGLNPYDVAPSARPDDVSYPLVGQQWRDTTTVYGPLFTLASEAVALVAGQSAAAAGLLFKALAGLSMVGVVLIVARMAPRAAFAAAFVGWNPVVAMQAAGSGHNDAIAGFALVLAVAFLSTRREAAGAVAAVAAALVKWTALVVAPLVAFQALARRDWRRLGTFAVVGTALVVLATLRYGLDWLGTLTPLAGIVTGTGAATSSMGLWHRLTPLGIPDLVAMALPAVVAGVVYLLVVRDAWRGRVRLGLAAGLFLVATPFLQPWYVLIPVSLAASEEDRPAQLLTLAFCAWGLNYLGDAGTVLGLFRG